MKRKDFFLAIAGVIVAPKAIASVIEQKATVVDPATPVTNGLPKTTGGIWPHVIEESTLPVRLWDQVMMKDGSIYVITAYDHSYGEVRLTPLKKGEPIYIKIDDFNDVCVIINNLKKED